MKNILRYTLILGLFLNSRQLKAQDPGSEETLTGAGIAGFYSSISETLYMGPGTYEIEGSWEIYSKNVWISPEAVISGNGTIKFFNPSDAGGAASPTLIDANNNTAFIGVNIELQNAENMVLTDMPPPADNPSWADAPGNANITIGSDFLFAVTNGDVLLGDHDMITATVATLTGYQPARFVVTNGTGHLVHENYTGNFIYPVGIAEGDYTPASVNNNATANTLHVLVQDYASSASIEAGANGIDRTWNIYADNAVADALINLQHNAATGQSSYNDAAAFVTQYGTAPNTTGQTTSQSAWQSNTLLPGSGTGTLTTGTTIADASELGLTYALLATSASDATSFFSKSSNAMYPLPVQLVSFEARETGCNALLQWTTDEEVNLGFFDLQRSTDGSIFTSVAHITPVGSNSSYAYTDKNISTADRLLYRLRVVDMDGKETYSNIAGLSATCGSRFFVNAYPNPISHTVTVSGISPETQLRIMNGLGQVVILMTATGTRQDIPVQSLEGGIYLLQVIRDAKIIKTIKLIKE